MNSEEYKKITNSNYVLAYGILDTTLKELNNANEKDLATEIERILKYNKIEKPVLHSKPHEKFTDYYKIDLTSDQVEIIADYFYNLEVNFVGKDGETTALCSYYASLADQWNMINE